MDKEKWIEEKGGVKKFIIEGKYLSLEWRNAWKNIPLMIFFDKRRRI